MRRRNRFGIRNPSAICTPVSPLRLRWSGFLGRGIVCRRHRLKQDSSEPLSIDHSPCEGPPLSIRKIAKSGQISSQTPQPTQTRLSLTCGGCTPIWLTFLLVSRASRGQNSMQKLQPLHRSSIMKMSASRSLRPSGCRTGMRLGFVGFHGLTGLAESGPVLVWPSPLSACTATLLTGKEPRFWYF